MSVDPVAARPADRRRIPPRVRLVEWAWRLSPATPRDLRRALSVPGQVNPSECRLLHHLAAAVPRAAGAIVEIGSYRGRSTVALALGARHGVPVDARGTTAPLVHAIDPHQPFAGVMGGVYGAEDASVMSENLRRCGVEDVVRCWRMPSLEAAERWHDPIGLLWIDGDHRPGAVAADVAAWAPYLSEQGRMALHDARRPGLGPTREVARLLATGRWLRDGGVGDIVVLRRSGRAGSQAVRSSRSA